MKRKLLFVWVGLIVYCTLFSAVFAQAPQETTVQKDVIYGQSENVDLKLDLAKPDSGNGPAPAVVCIHGGGWQLGNKSSYEPVIRQLAAHGYVAAAVEYRLTPKYRWPAQIHDVKCAVRYLRAHSKELNIDPDKMAALGDSAGGHLALLLGLMDPKDDFEGTGGNSEYPSKVQAVINYYGPADFRVWHVSPEGEPGVQQAYGKDPEAVLADFLGTSDRTAPVMVQVSPITYVNTGDPPILTFHGSSDPLVPVEQARMLHATLEKAGVPQKLVILEGAGHGWSGQQLEETSQQSLQFLESVFKPTPPSAVKSKNGTNNFSRGIQSVSK